MLSRVFCFVYISSYFRNNFVYNNMDISYGNLFLLLFPGNKWCTWLNEIIPGNHWRRTIRTHSCFFPPFLKNKMGNKGRWIKYIYVYLLKLVKCNNITINRREGQLFVLIWLRTVSLSSRCIIISNFILKPQSPSQPSPLLPLPLLRPWTKRISKIWY